MAKKLQPIIKRKEQHNFTLTFDAKELKEKKEELSGLLTSNWELERLITESKDQIKANLRKAGLLGTVIKDGGDRVWEECNVEINPNTMKKECFYKGKLVDTEDIDDDDLQTAIDDDQE